MLICVSHRWLLSKGSFQDPLEFDNANEILKLQVCREHKSKSSLEPDQAELQFHRNSIKIVRTSSKGSCFTI